jgi:hypothetical protein
MLMHQKWMAALACGLCGALPVHAGSFLVPKDPEVSSDLVLYAGLVLQDYFCPLSIPCLISNSNELVIGGANAFAGLALMSVGVHSAGAVTVDQYSALNFIPAYGQASVGYSAPGSLTVIGASAINGLAGITAGEGTVSGSILVDQGSIIRFSGVRGATIGDMGAGRLTVSNDSSLENMNGLTLGGRRGSFGEAFVFGGSLIAFKPGSGVTIGEQGRGALTLGGKSAVEGIGAMVVGAQAPGTLTLTTQSSVLDMSSLIVGETSKAAGSVFLSDSRITLLPGSPVVVGLGGGGMLKLTADSAMAAFDTVIRAGAEPGSLGDIVNQSSALSADRLELGSVAGGIGGYEQTDGELMLRGGNGPTIQVSQGRLAVQGRMTLVVGRDTVPVSASLASLIAPASKTSRAEIKGQLDLQTDADWGGAGTGALPAWLVARQIDLGVRRVGARIGGRLPWGDLSIKLDAQASSGRQWSPEILRVGCQDFFSGLQDCSVEVLTARSVAQASRPLIGATSLPELRKALVQPSAEILARAHSFLKEKRTLVGVDLSARIYQTGRPSALQREIASLDLDGLRAYAYETAYGPAHGDITIVIRGTEFSDGRNWATNLGFSGLRTGAQLEYIQNLGMFAASIASANPDAEIRFVGHSLGGGLAMILGAFYGKDAYAYNAPALSPVLQDLSYFDSYLPTIEGWSRRQEGDWRNLINIRSAHDPVSAGTSPLGSLGYTVTVAPNAIDYYLSTPGTPGILAQLSGDSREILSMLKRNFAKQASQVLVNGILTEINVAHAITNLRGQLYDPKLTVIDVSYNGESQASQDWSVDPGLLEQALIDRVFMPDRRQSGDFVSNMFNSRSVLSGVKYFLDPAYEDVYVFNAFADSPGFAMIQVPDLSIDGLMFDVQVLQGGDWTTLAYLLPTDEFFFDGDGVKTFRLILSGNHDHKAMLEGAFFAVAFSSDGVFDGSITSGVSSVPEPAMGCLALAALLVVGRAAQSTCSGTAGDSAGA